MGRISDTERLRRFLESAGGTARRQAILKALNLSVDRYPDICDELIDKGEAQNNPGRLGGLRLIDSDKPRRRILGNIAHRHGASPERTRSIGKHLSLGDRINLFLDKKGMSQRDLARQLYVTPLAVNNWVNDRNAPRGRNLQKLKRVLSSSFKKTPNHFQSNTRNGQNPPALKFQGSKLHRQLQEDRRPPVLSSNHV